MLRQRRANGHKAYHLLVSHLVYNMLVPPVKSQWQRHIGDGRLPCCWVSGRPGSFAA